MCRMKYGRAGWNISFFINENSHSGSKFPKFNKRAGWNKDVQDGKFPKINKICCTIIRQVRVLIVYSVSTIYAFRFKRPFTFTPLAHRQPILYRDAGTGEPGKPLGSPRFFSNP